MVGVAECRMGAAKANPTLFNSHRIKISGASGMWVQGCRVGAAKRNPPFSTPAGLKYPAIQECGHRNVGWVQRSETHLFQLPQD
ncbi:MAG: hypothetical protein B6245_17575 [Desulfobacteraceae bacterium 4572_88]|nr:MAG: hypothetical protein B6245_17575 [Desulfobacteraceae bacterium 4572_88]